ncbi:MAG: tRNA pseudouridine(55) synthase TruB [Polyangiales bacterium]
MDAVFIVDKSRGPTSHDVVSAMRRVLSTKKVGHAGTLDPMATGVLVVAVGEATKLVAYLSAHDKAYEATIRFGVATSSLDAEGEETDRVAVDRSIVDALGDLSTARDHPGIQAAFAIERARTSQVPPNVSAIKVDGVASHARARRGEDFALPPRDVVVRAIEIVGARREPPELDVTLDVGKGYYVRSFARDLAASLGTVAHLTALARTRSGTFDLSRAIDGASLMAARRGDVAIAERTRSMAIPMREAVCASLPTLTLDAEATLRARQGKRLYDTDGLAAFPIDAPIAWLSPEGALVAIGAVAIEEGARVGRVVRGFQDSAESTSVT